MGRIWVDLNAITLIDENGKAQLQQLHRKGGPLLALGCLRKAIVDEVTARASQDSKQKPVALPRDDL
ncbi:MAG: hypothetical protein NPIRA03_23240 [Nitrospirales bacterium]|nr:MAG: hypothetical protein NPIRA03_23240 [Nitrospirales bacterium]